LDIGPTVLTEWRFAFAGAGLSFFGLKDYSQRQGHLSVVQEQALKAHFTEHHQRDIPRVTVWLLEGSPFDQLPEPVFAAMFLLQRLDECRVCRKIEIFLNEGIAGCAFSQVACGMAISF
jgi:hypothetical protein